MKKLVVEILNLVKLKLELDVKFFIWSGGLGIVILRLILCLICQKSVIIVFLKKIVENLRMIISAKKLLNLLIVKYYKKRLWNMALEELWHHFDEH